MRYNINSDSADFVKSINAYNEDMRPLSIDDDGSKIKVMIHKVNLILF